MRFVPFDFVYMRKIFTLLSPDIYSPFLAFIFTLLGSVSQQYFTLQSSLYYFHCSRAFLRQFPFGCNKLLEQILTNHGILSYEITVIVECIILMNEYGKHVNNSGKSSHTFPN